MADLVTAALEQVVAQVEGATTALVPIGTATAGSLVVLAILMLGAALATGQAAFVRPIVGLCAASAGTLWVISTWPVIVRDTFGASQAILGRLTGGAGVLGLYTMAGEIAARILAQGGAISYWHPFNSLAQAVVCGVAAALVLLGMAVDGALVLLAQIEMLLGAAVAPLLLPGLAFGLTSQLGWGAVYALVRGAVRVIATGFVCGVMARATAAVVTVPGTDQVLTFSQMAQLMTLAVGTAMAGFVAYRLAGQMVGSPGVLGLSSVTHLGSVAGGMVGGAVAAGGMAASGGATAGAAVASAAAAKGGRGAAAGATLPRTSGSGSAFGGS